ncbi:hypothetical protein SANTM175S_00824 [Streptomyces antimycoticus]
MIEGMKVLSFSHFVQGPAASQYLADLGADVTKVDRRPAPGSAGPAAPESGSATRA